MMMGTYNLIDLTPKGRDERDGRWRGCATTTATDARVVVPHPAADSVRA
jgi:hypothetical protein